MKKRIFKLISLSLVLALFLCLGVACNKSKNNDKGNDDEPTDATRAPTNEDSTKTDSATEDSENSSEAQTTSEPASESQSETESVTETPSETVSETETETETETEEETTDLTSRNNEPTDPAHITFYSSKKIALKSTFTNPNQCTSRITRDSSFGTILTLQTNVNASDPYVTFNYAAYIKAHDMTPISADEYKYIVFTIKAEDCTNETFELFYCAGNITGPTAGYMKTASFNSTLDGWQKIVFDLSGVDFSGQINAFRLDFLAAPGSGKETVHIASMDFYKTKEEALGDLNIDTSRPGDGVEYEEHKFDGVNYDKVTAPYEDESLLLWFDHMTEKVPQHIVNPKNRYTYVINMAGNSIENCQVFLSPTVANANVNVSISDFKNSNGNTLKTQLLRENYLNINGVYYPDALPKIDGAVSIKAGNSQGFVIKVWADTNEEAGLYSATLTVTDAASGKVVKTANVYVNVLGFSLSEESSLKSAVGLSQWSIGVTYQNKGLLNYSGEELYKIYYDFLLENRLCAYQLPYSIYDNRCISYLDNPRVNSFVINKSGGDHAGNAYSVLKNNQNWMDKGFFYYVDEPSESGKLNELQNCGNQLAGAFPGYNQISPFFTNIDINGVDQIEFMSPYINIWCTKMFAFTPRDKYMMSGVQYMTSRLQDERYGTFAERIEEFRKNGEEMWLYICWEPEQPYTNWLIMGDGTETIVSIWQCKMTDADGILYWDTSYWNSSDPLNNMPPLIGATAHGDGVLLYSGAEVGSYEPISSMRLESIRQGMQDHMMLSMLDEATCDKFVAMVTEDVITYTNNDDYLNYVRQLLAFEVENQK